MRSHKKFGPDQFSRFDVYWIQTNKQTNRHPDKPNYIDSTDGYESICINFIRYNAMVITPESVDGSVPRNIFKGTVHVISSDSSEPHV